VALRSLYREPERAATKVDWPALEAVDVFQIYRSGPAETVALRGLHLRVEKGEHVAVLGPSGSGKTTLLTLAAGLDQPSAGELRALGLSLGRLEERELAAYRARVLALVFQSGNLWPGLSAERNVTVGLRLAGQSENAREQAHDALAAFGLGKRTQELVGALSGGEQQRVAIAAAAARRAELVLADEPTAELDDHNESAVVEALGRLREENGATVITVTHSERLAGEADRVVEIRDGRLVS
jgi:putative ABC transport system ATP-binding protein